jgi:dihydrofolate synthase/folylpolyglutamate synthase
VKTITNFDEAQVVLRRYYDNTRTKYNLDLMHHLMDFLGNPQNSFKVIHIAGTSGKTSTAYYSAALLQAAGYKVGLTVSPHVDQVNERLQINLQPLPEAQFCAALTEFLNVIEPSGIEPSYFELMVALAYWEFGRQKVDYAVIEVGLGGLVDGTNVISRTDKICVITDIGLDHTEILGDTLAKIAAQKAGIITANNHVFMYEQSQDVMDAIRQRVVKQKATLSVFFKTDELLMDDLPLFQQRNLGLALQTVGFAIGRQLQPSEIIQAANLRIPARLERLQFGAKTLIIDGSHNAQKLEALLGSIKVLYPGQAMAALVAFVGGNDERWQGGVQPLLTMVDHLIITSFTAEQDVPKASIDPERVAAYCRTAGFSELQVIANASEAFAELKKQSEPLLLVAGSFYLLNTIRPLIAKSHD